RAAAAGEKATEMETATVRQRPGSATAKPGPRRRRSRPRASASRPAPFSPQRVCDLPELGVGKAARAQEVGHALTGERRVGHGSRLDPYEPARALGRLGVRDEVLRISACGGLRRQGKIGRASCREGGYSGGRWW